MFQHQFDPAGKNLPLKLGLIKGEPCSIRLKDYIDFKQVAPLPATFGHTNLVPQTWGGMLGNDQYGDCVWAAQAGATMLWNAERGVHVPFTEASVLSDYSACTGFNPKDANTDQGTDPNVAAKYWQTTGVLDANGKRHKIVGRAGIDATDIQTALYATWWFQAIHFCMNFPNSAMTQFNAGSPWYVGGDGTIEGGHDVVLGGYDSTRSFAPLKIRTWGAKWYATVGYAQRYANEFVVPLSEEMLLAGGKDIDGLDMAALTKDLQSLN